MAASDATPFPIKNQAYRVIFPILDADGDLVTGAAGLDSEVSKDCGTFTDVTAEATEIATSSGMYYLDLTATEMNADVVAVIVKTTTTGAKTTPIVLYPVENADIPVNVKAISDDTTAPDNLELAFDGTGYGFTNCTMPTVTTLTGHTAQTGDSFARLGAPVGASIAADLLVIDNFVDELETRLTAARAGYLDNLSAGAVALASGVDMTSIHGAALTETVNGYLAAAFVKLFDVSTPLLVASDVMRGTDSAYTGTPPTVTQIRQEMDTNSTKMAPSQVLADYKATGFSTHSAADVKTAIEAVGSSIALILADTNELQTDWANGGRLDLLIDAILTDTGTTLDGKLDTILGLNQENFFVDNTTYSGGNMTDARIRIYSVAGSVGTASDVIATYTVTATYAGSEMTDYKVVKS